MKAQGLHSLLRLQWWGRTPLRGLRVEHRTPGNKHTHRVEQWTLRVEQRTLRVELRVEQWTLRVEQWTPVSSGPTGRPPNCCPRSGQRPLSGDGGAAGEVYGPPVGLDADLHLRRNTQLTQRQQLRGAWTAQHKSDQLHRLKIFYADPQTPRGDLDHHRYLSHRVAKFFGHQWYEGTIITYSHDTRNYGVYWDDGDSELGDLSVTLRLIEDW
jgi:hypothetical protein